MSATGMQTLRQKMTYLLKEDLASFKVTKLSCRHPVDTVAIDSNQVMLASAKAGLTLFDRHTSEFLQSHPENRT
jgi:hypothetical protein